MTLNSSANDSQHEPDGYNDSQQPDYQHEHSATTNGHSAAIRHSNGMGAKSPVAAHPLKANGIHHSEPPTSTTVSDAHDSQQPAAEFKASIVWFNVFLFVVLHSMLPLAIYVAVSQRPYRTLLWSVFLAYASGLGVTAGTHRLWSHRSYKASAPVEVLLMMLQTMAGQNSIFTWSRDHRVHHKYAETTADPHDITRGFFFAHMGWLMCRKHPDVKAKGKTIDMSDLEANSIVMFQHRHFWWLSVLFNLALPVAVPMVMWNERFWTSFLLSFALRYILLLHNTWLVNSAAHYWGSRPYDTAIEARESPLVIVTGLGEGFHNYHHTFPFDYSTSEFGRFFNLTTAFIDLCATLGLVHDRRKVDSELIFKRQMRTGDERLHKQLRRQRADSEFRRAAAKAAIL